MVQLTDNIWAVELTQLGDVFKSFRILPPDNVWTVPYLKYSYRSIYHTNRRGKDFYCSQEHPLEPGTWQYLFTTKGCSEENAKKVVKQYGPGFIDYEATEEDFKRRDVCWFKEAVLSLQSLLRSKNLDDKKNYAIILKQNDNGTEKNV